MRVSAAHLLDCAVEVRVHRAQPHRALQRPTAQRSAALDAVFLCGARGVLVASTPALAATGTRVLSGAHVRAPGTQQHPAAPGRHWRTWSGSMLPWVAASCSAFTDEISRSFRSSSCIVRAWAGVCPCERARARASWKSSSALGLMSKSWRVDFAVRFADACNECFPDIINK